MTSFADVSNRLHERDESALCGNRIFQVLINKRTPTALSGLMSEALAHTEFSKWQGYYTFKVISIMYTRLFFY